MIQLTCDANGVGAWIDSYCQAHPLDALERAAVAFYREHPN